MITTYCLMWLGQASGRPTDPKMWEVRCPVHGLHRGDQKNQPITRKNKVQLSRRCVRQCWKRLTSAVQVRQKESTKARGPCRRAPGKRAKPSAISVAAYARPAAFKNW